MTRPQFARFRDLDYPLVNRDLQLHTVATDGRATIQQLIERAEQIGLAEIAFTEHVRETSVYYPDFAAQVRRARQHTDVTVHVGIEAKALNEHGSIDAATHTLSEAEIVLGSVHRFPAGGGALAAAREFDYEAATEREFALAMGLVQQGPIDVLSHPGGMCQRAFGSFPDRLYEALMRASVESGVAIEINSSYTRDMDHFIELCRRFNPIVSVGSDVHAIDELGTCRQALLDRSVA